MTKKVIILVLLCIVSLSSDCPGFNAGDLLQSGKSIIVRGRQGNQPDQVYEAPVNFPIPASGIEIAVTTGTIGDYNPLPNYGYNYYIQARRLGTTNSIQYKIIINNDDSWSTIQLSYLVSGRTDMTIGNIQFAFNQWTSYGSSVYNVESKILKNLPKVNYKVAAFISGFSTTDSKFSLTVSKKWFQDKKLTVGFYSSADPPVLTLTISYIIYPQSSAVLEISYELQPKGETGSYQISGPVNFQPNKRIQYNEWRVENRNLACTGNECTATCVLREQCLANNGNLWQGQCIYCSVGIVFQAGICTRKCGPNQIYINRVCLCNQGFKQSGKDCVDNRGCGANQEYSNSQKKCVCKRGFASINGQCKECPDGSTVTPNGKECNCGVNQIYDEISNSCKNRCYQNQRWVNNKCQCIAKFSWWNQKCRRCPENADQSNDQSTCICKSRTASYNPEANQCVECGANYQVNKNKCVCKTGYTELNGACVVVSKSCKANEQYNSSTKKCQCKSEYVQDRDGTCKARCSAGQVWKNGVCTFQCAPNEIINVITGKCDCQNGLDRGNDGVCKPRCPANEQWKDNKCICGKGQARYGTCKRCPAGSLPNSDRSKCICRRSNQYFSSSSFYCVNCPANTQPKPDLSGCACRLGYTKSGSSCILNCEKNEQFNAKFERCQCIFGYYRVNKNCVPRCKDTEEWNGKSCICKPGYGVSNSKCRKCPGDASANQARTSCQCTIPNYIFNPTGWKCEPCQQNSHNSNDDSKCICDDGFQQSGQNCISACDVNEQINPTTKKCDCKYGFLRLGPSCVDRCGLNQDWNGKECLCKENNVFSSGVCRPCPTGLVTNPTRKACLCKDSKQYWSAAKFSCQTCPPYSSPNSDFTDCVCYSGYTKQLDSCVSTCPGGSFPDNTGKCVCEGGKILQGATCVQPPTCPPKSSWNQAKLECLCANSAQHIIDGKCQLCGSNSFFSALTKKCECSTGFFRIGGDCVTCDPRTKYNGTDCVCNLGYFGNRDKCEKCHSSCSSCSGPQSNKCLSCSDVSLVFQSGYCSKQTPCDPGFFLDSSACTKCSDNCISCENIFACEQCAIGYQVSKVDVSGQSVSICKQICGDGIKYQAECDDGNTKDGDGCSNTCVVEQGWTCVNGSSNRKSTCNKFLPDQTILINKGVVNLGDRVIQGVRCDYLPTCLTKNQCSTCFKVLKVNVVEANVPILTKVNYVPLSQYQFIIEYNFQGLLVTSKFKVVIKLNEEFKGCLADDDFTQQIELDIDPAFLALIDADQVLTPDQLNPDSTKIVVPDEASSILWNGR